jgi:hypothetical protein
MKEDKDNNPFVAITAVTGGIFLVIAVVFLIFAKADLALLIPIVWGFVILGVFAEFFAYLAVKK